MERLEEIKKLDQLATECAGESAVDLYEGLPAFLAALNSASVSLGAGEPSLRQLRASAAAVREPWNQGGPAMLEIHDLELAALDGPMRARLYRPTTERPAPTLVYMHGGGWALLSIDTHDRLMREYAAASGWTVIGLDYPRAPETVFPHISEACLAAIRDLRERSASLGLAAERMVLGGDSSGANLAVALALAMRDSGHAPARGMLLNYGVYDSDLTRPSYKTFSADPFQLTAEKISWFWQCYCRDEARRQEPLASPLRANLVGLPPAHLVIAGKDVLLDENEAFVAALEGAGTSVSIDRYPHAPHAFLEALTLAPISQLAIMRAGQWLQRVAAT